MLQNKRTVAMMICLTIVLTLLLSMTFIVAESDHDCAGVHCAVCQDLQICRKTLKFIGFALISSSAVAVFLFFAQLLDESHRDSKMYVTLVSLKVKLTE